MRSPSSRRVAAVVVALCLLSGAARAIAAAIDDLESAQEALYAHVQPSVVLISDGHSFGSGFFVSRDGLILTNAHVVGDAREVDVVTADGKQLRGRVLERAAKDTDLALVEVKLGATPPLRFARGELRVGAWVGAVGHGMGGVWAFTTGMVSNVYPVGDARPIFQTQIPLNPGNSGGPVFDKHGDVVGIVTAGIKEANSINLAVRSGVALETLGQLADRCECLVIDAAPRATIFVDDQPVGHGPRVILPIGPGEHDVVVQDPSGVIRRALTFPTTRHVRALPAEKR